METHPWSVLLVDDEARTLELLSSLLRRQGFVVTPTTTTGSAIELLRTGSFDAVVTDVIFDGRAVGKEILRAARARSPSTVVLLMTGYPAVDAAVSAMRDGANDYIEKPVDGQLLGAKIERALRGRESSGDAIDFVELVEILSRLVSTSIERIDPYTAGHGERTRRYSDILARELGIDVATRERLALAAVAHDYGKIFLADLSFLTKRGPLTDDEFREVRRHPMLGSEKLGNHVRLRDVCMWISEHHERWDGKGYPARKAGDQISLCGRILAVVEVFDSLATRRSYKEAWDLERVIEYFKAGRELAFDPLVLDAFLPKLERFGMDWLHQPRLDRRAASLT
ncbi:MAG: response regulator [Planctomycetes bacterium]|nr:response regulator [Planctomycetota bacterium]